MFKIKYFLFFILLIDCIFNGQKINTHYHDTSTQNFDSYKRRISIFSEARVIQKKKVIQAEFFTPEVPNNIGSRINSILNNEITYIRKTIDVIQSYQERTDEEDEEGNNDNINSKNIFSYHQSSKINKFLKDKSTITNDDNDDSVDNANNINNNIDDDTVLLDKYKNEYNSRTKSSSLSQFDTYVNENMDSEMIQVENDESLSGNNDSKLKLPSDLPFNFTIECLDTEYNCNFISNKLENAGIYISNVFNIYETINVEVNILPFCEHMKSINCEDITALTYPPNFITLNITNQGLYSYPQALLKQLELKDKVNNYSDYDIILYFNTDYFNNNQRKNYLLVAAHELIHGMGFFHLLTTVNSAYNTYFAEDRVIPQPYIYKFSTLDGVERITKGWIPFTIFDRYIVETDNPDFYIHQGIKEYLNSSITKKIRNSNDVYRHFEKLNVTQETTNYSKYLAKSFSTRKALGFRTFDGEIVPLQTYEKYEPMSSISHIHSPFSCDTAIDCYVTLEKLEEVDEDYLMYYTIIPRSVNDLIRRYSSKNAHGFIGDRIVKIMLTLGWTEKESLNEFKLFEDIILANEASSSSTSIYLINKKKFYFFSFILFCLLNIF